MNRKIKLIANGLLVMTIALVLVTCASHPQLIATNGTDRGTETSPANVGVSTPQSTVANGTNQGTGAFRSNGERIYFTSSSDRGTSITSTGGSATGGMMGNGSSGGMMNGGSSGGMVGNGNLSCAACHGADGRGPIHTMMGMQTMQAPDIRWSALESEFDTEKFRLAVTQGQDPDGEKQLNHDMPRWNIGNDDLADLISYLKTLS